MIIEVFMTIKNGMHIQLKSNLTPSDLFGIEKTNQLVGKIIHLKGNGASKILDDGRVMIKGIGYFPQDLFEEATEVFKENKNDGYCIILMTKEAEGEYTHYDDTIYHEINEIGILIECSNGDEHFHPWTFEGGIERITKKDKYFS
jgi:hypothetical protein